LAETRRWPALVVVAAQVGQDDVVAAILDDFAPAAIEDLTDQPVPPAGLWDPTFDPPPEPPPAPLHWRVYFSSETARADAERALDASGLGLTLRAIEVSDDNWAARSQQALTAISAGRFVVAPPWDVPRDLEGERRLIIIEPSRGFGTGHHQSTRLCLRALSDVSVTDARVLDLGTGSGVLAMAAALGGASEVVAVDVDGDAIEAARESAALNTLPVAIEFVIADFRDPTVPLNLRQCSVVVANLTGGMLTASANEVMQLVAPGGALVVSGFDQAERDRVAAAFSPMVLQTSYEEDGWISLVFRSQIAPYRP
jgi:ribosomal protein L11 methyltransferase